MSATAGLDRHRGIGQFGPAYHYMLANDAHAPGSVDRVLLERMVRLRPETAQVLYAADPAPVSRYVAGTRPGLEARVRDAVPPGEDAEVRVRGLLRLTRGIAEAAAADLVVGGTEEAILTRGTDWCVDLARALCALCQVAGVPARLAMLFNLEQAYSGHQIVEAWRCGVWGAVDAVTGVAYEADGMPLTTWQLMQNPDRVAAHRARYPHAAYCDPGQFRAAAIAGYDIADADGYDYTESGLNDYYRQILEMADRGWPGGLRWLCGEDGGTPDTGSGS